MGIPGFTKFLTSDEAWEGVRSTLPEEVFDTLTGYDLSTMDSKKFNVTVVWDLLTRCHAVDYILQGMRARGVAVTFNHFIAILDQVKNDLFAMFEQVVICIDDQEHVPVSKHPTQHARREKAAMDHPDVQVGLTEEQHRRFVEEDEYLNWNLIRGNPKSYKEAKRKMCNYWMTCDDAKPKTWAGMKKGNFFIFGHPDHPGRLEMISRDGKRQASMHPVMGEGDMMVLYFARLCAPAIVFSNDKDVVVAGTLMHALEPDVSSQIVMFRSSKSLEKVLEKPECIRKTKHRSVYNRPFCNNGRLASGAFEQWQGIDGPPHVAMFMVLNGCDFVDADWVLNMTSEYVFDEWAENPCELIVRHVENKVTSFTLDVDGLWRVFTQAAENHKNADRIVLVKDVFLVVVAQMLWTLTYWANAPFHPELCPDPLETVEENGEQVSRWGWTRQRLSQIGESGVQDMEIGDDASEYRVVVAQRVSSLYNLTESCSSPDDVEVVDDDDFEGVW